MDHTVDRESDGMPPDYCISLAVSFECFEHSRCMHLANMHYMQAAAFNQRPEVIGIEQHTGHTHSSRVMGACVTAHSGG